MEKNSATVTTPSSIDGMSAATESSPSAATSQLSSSSVGEKEEMVNAGKSNPSKSATVVQDVDSDEEDEEKEGNDSNSVGNVPLPPPDESEETPMDIRKKRFAAEENRSCFFEERLKRGEERRSEGNEQFKQGNISGALELYERALYHTDFDELQWNFELMEQHQEQVSQVRLPLFLNMAACYLKEGKSVEVIEACQEALKIDPHSCKALYRRAQAYRQRGRLEEAQEDLTQLLKIDQTNQDARKELVQVKELLKVSAAKEKEMWKQAMKSGGLYEDNNSNNNVNSNHNNSNQNNVSNHSFGSSTSNSSSVSSSAASFSSRILSIPTLLLSTLFTAVKHPFTRLWDWIFTMDQ